MTELNVERKTIVVCPICQAQKAIEIPGYALKQESVDILRLQVHNPSVCEHDFVAFVDQTGKVRGYELIDYSLQFTARPKAEHSKANKLFLEDILETLGNFTTLCVFHAFLFNYRTFIILEPNDRTDFEDQVNDLFTRIFPKDVPVEDLAHTIDQEDFMKLDLAKTGYLIIDTKGLVTNAPWGDWRRFDVENDIIRKALEIIDAKSQAELIQQEIYKLKSWVDSFVLLLEKEKIAYEHQLKKKLSSEFGVKFTNYHLDLCKLYITRRLPEKVPLLTRIRNKTLDSLKESFW